MEKGPTGKGRAKCDHMGGHRENEELRTRPVLLVISNRERCVAPPQRGRFPRRLAAHLSLVLVVDNVTHARPPF